MFKIFFLVLFLCASLSNGQLLTGHNYLMEQFQKSAKALDLSSIETNWIDQPIDHFNKNDTRYFKMKYFEKKDERIQGKPIYIYIGGEGPLNAACLSGGLIYELAEETNGAMFATEHRYYGQSQPFQFIDEMTTADFRFLSSKQALADIATFISYLKRSPAFSGSKVVVIGGSYAGNLAAWMRLRYPHLVDAAISSSAPVLAKLDFFEYFETVGDDFKKYAPPECFTFITQQFNLIKEALKTEDGIEELKNQLNICKSSDLTRRENQELFFNTITYPLAITAQYGTPANIQNFCIALKNNDDNIFKDNDDSCSEFDFDKENNNRTRDYIYSWIYQTCTEFGYFMTTPHNDPLSSITLDENFYIKTCNALFGPEFNKNAIENSIKRTNDMYGGLRPNVTNVIFVHGEIDPWHRLGVTQNLSETVPAWVIPGASHCNDLLPDSRVTEAVKKMKSLEKMFIKKIVMV